MMLTPFPGLQCGPVGSNNSIVYLEKPAPTILSLPVLKLHASPQSQPTSQSQLTPNTPYITLQFDADGSAEAKDDIGGTGMAVWYHSRCARNASKSGNPPSS